MQSPDCDDANDDPEQQAGLPDPEENTPLEVKSKRLTKNMWQGDYH